MRSNESFLLILFLFLLLFIMSFLFLLFLFFFILLRLFVLGHGGGSHIRTGPRPIEPIEIIRSNRNRFHVRFDQSPALLFLILIDREGTWIDHRDPVDVQSHVDSVANECHNINHLE